MLGSNDSSSSNIRTVRILNEIPAAAARFHVLFGFNHASSRKKVLSLS